MPGFQAETGIHTIQRIPPTERRGRVHTSTVSVSVLDGVKREEPKVIENDLSFRWFSGTGKGGQHRNRHANCLEITHLPTGIKQVANGRSRDTNMRDALAALKSKLATNEADEDTLAANFERKSQISEIRRTYRFRDDMVKDHTTGKQTTCASFMRGKIDKLWS